MRKYAALTIAFLLLYGLFPASFVQSAVTAGDEDANAIREQSNKDMEELYHRLNYFPKSTAKGSFKVMLRTEGGTKHGDIVYGSPHGTELTHKGVRLFRYSGYSRIGESFPNMEFPWDAGWSGIKIQDFDLIRSPWGNADVKESYKISKGAFDLYEDENGGTLENAIITGLNYAFGSGQTYSNFMYGNKNSEFKDRTVYTRNAKPRNGGDWIDYVHILQPPTMRSWGLGTVYIRSVYGGITYLNIPIAPFVLVADLDASFELLPSGAIAGKHVRVGVRVKSSFKKDVKPSFRWRIETSDGTPLTASFDGTSNKKSGELTIGANGEAVLYASFIMPDSDVRIRFDVNEDRSLQEEYMGNNSLDSQPKAIKLITPIKLDYDVLSRKVNFPLMNGNPITAQLNLPQGRWSGNATGALDVTNDTPGLLRDDKVTGNPPVNEDSETIERNPIFHATVKRKDFGDDPIGRQWSNLADPGNSILKSGSVSYSGEVSRTYEYDYNASCDANGNCEKRTKSETVTAPFDSGTDFRWFETFVYNGRENLPEMKYKEEIEQNDLASKTKKLFWQNEPYPFYVIRWMHHLDENGNKYGWTPVDGQYRRTFTEQASGVVGWKAERAMARDYEQSRTAASDNSNRKPLYDRAVFATDRELQKYDYPIKSGYYFNPAGTYTFTVETVTFKPTPADTQDHKDLVDAVIDSFRYETDLMYINSKKAAVNIRNEPLSPSGGGFERKTGILTAENNKGVDGQVLLIVLDRTDDESRYSKKVEELEHSEAKGSDSHPSWKKAMEGYGDSRTQESESNYRYVEYVKSGQHMYKITETTRVSIVINKDNLNVYTHANMPNGTYYVRAWIADVALDREQHAYRTLGTLKGVRTLDEINVTVHGSMYDDLNN
ncbi:Athe_2463 domain-containing protein [Paenibacillus alkalitolerans]|uniref:Athe_2463 domain-containing protein n=1 Tax=Paenibacillus alkalitolerans TaxID=2799335 RepID=UPI0018F3ACCD|nr:hypothetical protein [Paenibacillus alkalitolerans]